MQVMRIDMLRYITPRLRSRSWGWQYHLLSNTSFLTGSLIPSGFWTVFRIGMSMYSC